MSFQSLNALRSQANECRNKMLAASTQSERRTIIDGYASKLSLIGFKKIDLQYEIYCITMGI